MGPKKKRSDSIDSAATGDTTVASLSSRASTSSVGARSAASSAATYSTLASSSSSGRTSVTATPGQRIPSFANSYNINPDVKKRLRHLVAPHVDSFNYFLASGLSASIQDIPPMRMRVDEGVYIQMKYIGVDIAYPMNNDEGVNDERLTPREARERGMTYAGAMSATVEVTYIKSNGVDGEEREVLNIPVKMGSLPLMVMSERCHLRGCSSRVLVQMKEEANEMGGYFIVNGIERVIRLLQVPRRNYASAISRNSYKKRGNAYSDKGVAMRCVRPDQTSVTITLHYLNNGGATLKFVLRKQEFLLPVIIVAKAMCDISDKEFFDRVVQGDTSNTFMTARLELLLRDAKNYGKGLFTRALCAAFLGSLFRNFLPIADETSDEDAGYMLIKRYLFVHTDDFECKLECLLHMLRKLFAFAQGKCEPDNADALMSHEILLPGHLMTLYVKEKMEDVFINVKQNVMRDYRLNQTKTMVELRGPKIYQRLFQRFAGTLTNRICTFLSTGNIISSTGLDLMQVSGYTIVAERLNIFRYMSHFQSVHRGQFFTTMKTTTVRKLLPESWGFMCPVHTPDGSPCGLLNHLARDAVILAFPPEERAPTTSQGVLVTPSEPGVEPSVLTGSALRRLLVSQGVVPSGLGGGDGCAVLGQGYVPVLVEGLVVGGVAVDKAAALVASLRVIKVTGRGLDPTTELAYIPFSPQGGAYPGLYIFTQPGRLIRQVRHLHTDRPEWIGPMEQVFMEIACLGDDVRPGTTHIEMDATVMLSQVAAFIPYCDYNQSPRNMYQCQMGKQTMGTPAHALRHRSDNKLYRIQNPQAPLVQTRAHREYCMDEYPQGTNAVVAVISFTGYDMEDAMIINKGAFERGFGHGSMYKTTVVDLDDEEKTQSSLGSKPSLRFMNIKVPPIRGTDDGMAGEKYCDELDYDGLPMEGEVVEFGQPLCCFVDSVTGDQRYVKHKESERAYVDTVRVLGSGAEVGAGKRGSARRVSITLRYRRNPVIGDKFSSRHGQKGTLSVLWPQENMPFTESGMTPDVLINPHAFPSRMTIGMLIESMAGKSGAIHGHFQDATPFQFHEGEKIIDYMGEQLLSAGYHFYGSEPLYSGLSGKAMRADIFIGVVFYQRLRHMVSDKSQVRATGPVNPLHHQPVKGRKKHGGIRLGEMERDALLSHGVAFCLHDRLMNSSDTHLAHVCKTCGNLLNIYSQSAATSAHIDAGFRTATSTRTTRQNVCNTCKSAEGVRPVYLPYVYRYLTNELAAMGIRLTLKISE